ncbi:pyruvate dehydrogenase E2 component (dihydrolipoamide acetyltransferase) [Rhizobium subbaraonis]|uniref:Pyruvate dehydrogenase E2 component (Dihydrolipoamide acetyltransferase) n=1 Tax=Rhizobium subbaraonis TaxID=908946 RepID=A0A285UYI6_9HYPH|nr:acetoin dehydrogenase dihydrolipoyllysine-residue acetyltransferase subunit [Rhizobium subbaraonis]SOC46428.1 pyruvate dehydrogenase E2 component (dihydrolipoamide acetyltransferase) [Rhizobium subbaraonis]
MANHPISIESAGGEYMESVLVLGWAVRPGEPVTAGQLIVTVETAKAATEVEAERDGWLAETFFVEGQEAPVGAVLGTISDTKPADASAGGPKPRPPAATAPVLAAATAEGASREAGAPVAVAGGRVIASPLARRLAREAGLDLSGIAGSGPRGRIKQRDVAAALSERAEQPAMPSTVASAASPTAPMARVAPQAPVASSVARHAEPVILLHGFGADRSAWRQVLPLLPADFETITLDLPGHGAETGRTAQGIEDLALDVSDRIEALGIERAHLVGHSLGGATALALTALGRVAVRSLTLLAPGGLGPEINAGFIGGLTRSTTAEALERWLAVMVADPNVLPQGYARAVLRNMERSGQQAVLAGLAERLFAGGTQAFDLLAALRRVSVPTRIVWGRSDRVIPHEHSLRAPGSAAVHLLDGVGHVPQMEAPELTARLISETLRSAG